MEKIDKAVIDLLETLPSDLTSKLKGFGVDIPHDWALFEDKDKLTWLNHNREEVAKFFADVAKNLEIVSRALVGKAGALELLKLYNFARKAK